MKPITIRRIQLTLTDIIGINLAFLSALFFHYEGNIPQGMIGEYIKYAMVLNIGKLMIYRYFQLYDSLWEYASIEELIRIVGAVLSANFMGIFYLSSMGYRVYYGIYIVSVIIEICFVGGIRFSFRLLRRLTYHQSATRQESRKHVLVIGCGATASMIATEIKNHPESYGQLVGYIDDDPFKLNETIAGIRVIGNRYDIYSVAKRFHVEEIIIAIPTASPKDTKEILAECKRCNTKVRIIPGVRDVLDGHVSMSKIRDVELEDLLGRDPVNLNVGEISTYIRNKTVLVTGGGGSIGSELCRQIALFRPKKLVILDNYENNAYDIQNELHREHKELAVDIMIGSIRDRDNVFSVMEEVRPDVIFHAAAHKHVPLMERSPKEAIKNNVFGTLNVAEAAHQFGVKRFVMISTDKAVNPTNVMGASKRMCEMIIQGLSKTSETKFVAVRFGNVLGSNGSVIPLFKQQIRDGGPITVTHKDITRYFMTISEAAQLVLQAGAIAEGGEIFVLDMGEPVKIYDLAVDIIKLSGLIPFEDIDIEITGLRPGEKLYEELLMDEELLKRTNHNKIFICKPCELDMKMLKKNFEQLERLIKSGDAEEVRAMMRHVVPTYRNAQDVNTEPVQQESEIRPDVVLGLELNS